MYSGGNTKEVAAELSCPLKHKGQNQCP